MALIFANIIGWIVSHKRLVLYGVGAIALIIVFGLIWRSCSDRGAKLNEQEIQKAQQAIAKQDREAMVKILAESETRETAIDKTLQEAEKATQEAKKNYNSLTNAELAAELERRSKGE